MSSSSKRNASKKEMLAHILAGAVILVHAYEKFELHEPSYIFFLIGGIIFLLVAFFHHQLARRFHYIDGIFFLIEAICYAIIAADYFHAGKKALPWCYVIVAIGYCCVAVIKARKGKAKYKQEQH